jgi:hypothetical protein
MNSNASSKDLGCLHLALLRTATRGPRIRESTLTQAVVTVFGTSRTGLLAYPLRNQYIDEISGNNEHLPIEELIYSPSEVPILLNNAADTGKLAVIRTVGSPLAFEGTEKHYEFSRILARRAPPR